MVRFIVAAILFPTALFLIALAIRCYKKAPVSSPVDFVGLSLIFDGLLIADPSHALTHMKLNFGTDVVEPVTLLFLAISFPIWAFCLLDIEPRITEHYMKKRVFPLMSWLVTWAISIAVVVFQFAFFTGHIQWFS